MTLRHSKIWDLIKQAADDDDEGEFHTLHSLHLKGMTTPEHINQTWGMDNADHHLQNLQQKGHAIFRETPRMKGYMITPSGREEHAKHMERVQQKMTPEDHETLSKAHDYFNPVNDEFKKLCTNWQMRHGGLNDHTDHEYDNEQIDHLDNIHSKVIPLVNRMAKAVPHFKSYSPRLRAAHKAVVDKGDKDYFTKPSVDSYHNIWFEMHQDLLDTLGQKRGLHEASRKVWAILAEAGIYPSNLYGGYIEQRRDGTLHSGGEPVKKLYRVVHPKEWEMAQQNGYLQSHQGYTRASLAPDERFRRQSLDPYEIAPPGHTLEIDYSPEDKWHASGEGYAATHQPIPLHRVRRIANVT